MAKLKLVAAPTFRAKVGIPVAGGEPVEVEMTFKHRTKTELEVFPESIKGKTNTEAFMEMVVGWELEDAFTKENVDLLMENYSASGVATYRVYFEQLTKAKLGNSGPSL